jgi:hypothetical protein
MMPFWARMQVIATLLSSAVCSQTDATPAQRFQQTVEAGLFTHAMCQSLSELFSCCVAVPVSAKGFWCAVALSGTPEPANRRLIVAACGGRAGCGGCLVYGLWLSCQS